MEPVKYLETGIDCCGGDGKEGMEVGLAKATPLFWQLILMCPTVLE